MQNVMYDEPIPPLDRPGVTPLWRLLAVVSLIAAAVLAVMFAVLFVAFTQQGSGFVNNNWGMVPPAPMAPGGAAAADDAFDPVNPPYPTTQDLRPAGTFPLPGEVDVPADNDALLPAQEFRRMVAKGIVWTSNDLEPPDRILVSPNGRDMAYTIGDTLMAGPVGLPEAVDLNAVPGGAVGPRGRRFAPAMMAQPAGPRSPDNGTRAVVCGWTDDALAWVSAGGTPRHVILQRSVPVAHKVPGPVEAALLLPGPGERLLVVRCQTRGKVDGAGATGHDLTEVFVTGPEAGKRLLIPASPAQWHSPALAPDGKRVAIVSDQGEKPGQWRVFVLSLDGNGAKPEPLSPLAGRIEGVCWTPDGKSLLYARSQAGRPADRVSDTKDVCDLFSFDLEARKETRLSRGGGLISPSMTKDGDLYFLTRTAPVNLVKLALDDVQKVAASWDDMERERAKLWLDLAADVFKGAGVPIPEGRKLPGPESLKTIADAFAKLYPAKLKDDLPATTTALDRQLREVEAIDRADFRVMLGAVAGEHLRRRHKDSAWHVGPGALDEVVSGENPFGYACNPFRPGTSLAEVLYRAEGRPLVLGNDAAAAKAALDRLIDPDLTRGTDLLNQGKGDEADGVLLGMVKRHEDNYFLVVHVGSLLQQHGRAQALAALLQPALKEFDAGAVSVLPKDARLFNLLGLVLLGTKAAKAITAFQDAVRCDLDYGPAYLNLAAAYELAQRKAEARLCLRRYLKLFAKGEWADDARRRLATAGDN
jgi:hypothetical protein